MSWFGRLFDHLFGPSNPHTSVVYHNDPPAKYGRRETYDMVAFQALSCTKKQCKLDFHFAIRTKKKIQSRGGGVWPTVDLHNLSCICDRFVNECSAIARGSPQRLCRHLLVYLSRELGDSHPYLEAMAEDGYSRAHTKIYEIRCGDRIICWAGASVTDAPFFSVYASTRLKSDLAPPGSGRLLAYRLSCSGGRWAYGEAPFGAGNIKIALAGLGVWNGARLK